MKKTLLISLFTLIGLGSFAQSFVLDTTFTPFFDIRLGRSAIVNSAYEDPNSGRLYITGNFVETFLGNRYEGILTCDSAGSVSTPFSYGGGSTSASVSEVWRNGLNELYVHRSGIGGFVDTSGNVISTSSSWRINGIRTVACSGGRPFFYPNGSSLFANGRDNSGKACKIVQGTDTFPGRHITKLTPQGLWDSTFNHDATYGDPEGFMRYDSNRIFIYGTPSRFSHYDSIPINGMCRIYLDGTLDTTFSSPINPNIFGGTYLPTSADSQGRFFIVGTFYLSGDTFRTFLVRLNANGSIDTTFQYRNGALAQNGFGGINTIVETPDKGYLAGGYFNSYQGISKKSIVKLDSNGVVEPQYFTSLGPDSADQFLFAQFQGLVSAIVPSKFGGYYVAGNFLKWDGRASQPIVKLTGFNGGIPVGLNETSPASTIAQHDKVLVYPNPSNGFFSIESELGIDRVEVFDLSGLRLSLSLTNSKKSLNLKNLANGIYFLKVTLENGAVVTKKVIKQ